VSSSLKKLRTTRNNVLNVFFMQKKMECTTNRYQHYQKVCHQKPSTLDHSQMLPHILAGAIVRI
jgi:hypothetical protein